MNTEAHKDLNRKLRTKSGHKIVDGKPGKRIRRVIHRQAPVKWALPPRSLLSQVQKPLRQVLDSTAWARSKTQLPLAFGQDVSGEMMIPDLARIPHVLIGGGTMSFTGGFIHLILDGLLSVRTPDELRLILIAQHVHDLAEYNNLPHLLAPVIIDLKEATCAMRWALEENERRSKLFRRAKVRDIASFNRRRRTGPSDKGKERSPARLPHIIIVISELWLLKNSLYPVVPQIEFIAMLARRTGIHLVIATTRPSETITKSIQSYIPGRVAGRMSHENELQVIFGKSGADKLNNARDILVRLKTGGMNRVRYANASWYEDIKSIAKFWKRQGKPRYEPELQPRVMRTVSGFHINEDYEKHMPGAIEVVRKARRWSEAVIMMQRRLKIGYPQATMLVAILREKGMGRSSAAESAKASHKLIWKNSQNRGLLRVLKQEAAEKWRGKSGDPRKQAKASLRNRINTLWKEA